MGRVCPPLRLTMVILRRLLKIREGRCLLSGKSDGDPNGEGGRKIMCVVKEDVWFHVGRGRHGRAAKGTLFKVK